MNRSIHIGKTRKKSKKASRDYIQKLYSKTQMLRCFLFIICCCFVQNTIGQTPHIRQFTDLDGLPSMNIYTVTEADNGLIWLTTDNGICYFDGSDFVEIFHPKMKDLDFVGAYKDLNGLIWFWNWSGQVFYFEKGRLQLYSPNNSLDSTLVRDLVMVNPNEIWILTPPGEKGPLICKNGNACEEVRIRPNKINQILQDISEHHTNGNFQFEQSRFFEQTQPITLFDSTLARSTVTYSRNYGFLFIPTLAPTSAWQYNYRKKQSELSLFFSFKDIRIRKIYEDKEDNLWILTDNKPLLFNRKLEKKDIQYPFINQVDINNLLHDKKGHYWFATKGEGLYYIANQNFKSYNSSTSTNFKNIVGIVSGNNGEVVVASSSGYLTSFDKNGQILKTKNLGFNIKKIIKRLDVEGYWLISSFGIYQVSADFSSILYVNNLGGTKNLYEDEISLMIGRGVSAHLFLKKRGTAVYSFSEIFPYRVIYKATYAFEKKEDDLFLGTLDGLYCIKGYQKKTKDLSIIERSAFVDELETRTTTAIVAEKFKVLPLQSPINNSWIQDIYNSSNKLWIATNNYGVFCVENRQVTQVYNIKNGLSSNNCTQILEDKEGLIWLATPRGINIINPKTGNIKIVKSENGLPANHISQLYFEKDMVWAGTPRGLSIFNKNEIKGQDTLGKVVFTKALINGQDTLIEDEYTLSFRDNSIQLGFVLPSTEGEKFIKYYYRLNNSNWVETNSKELSFSNLSPGKYKFQIYGSNVEGLKSPINQDVTFIILKPFWQKWWFYLIEIILGGGAISLITFLIFNEYRKRRERAINFRRELSESKMQALQSQMNPHFIFNALNAIQHFFTSDARELALLHLNKFAKLIRLIFEYSKETRISLTEELHFLKLYLELEGLRFDEKIKIDLYIDENIASEMIYLPPLMLQPMIENAFKHGLLHKETKGHLNIEFKKISSEQIKCIIQDDGIGREAAKEYNKWRMKEHRASGLENTKERIQLYNQEFEENSISLEIIDLKDEDGKTSGTRVEFLIRILEEE